jgi:hypothetical protein
MAFTNCDEPKNGSLTNLGELEVASDAGYRTRILRESYDLFPELP